MRGAWVSAVSVVALGAIGGCGPSAQGPTRAPTPVDPPGEVDPAASTAFDGALHASIIARFPERAEVFELTDDGYRVCGEALSFATVRASGEPLEFVASQIRLCGCANGGRTLAVGDRFPCDDGCNTCTCSGPDSYTTTLADCRIEIAEQIYFPAGAIQVSSRAEPILGHPASGDAHLPQPRFHLPHIGVGIADRRAAVGVVGLPDHVAIGVDDAPVEGKITLRRQRRRST